MRINCFKIIMVFCFGITSMQAQETPAKPVPVGNPEVIPENNTTTDENTIYNSVEVQPEFPGGLKAFYKYISKNYKMPQVNLNGNVFVTFVVERDGSLTEIKVMRDLGYGTGEEAARVLKESPKWKPGIQDGKTVRTRFNLPIKIVRS